MKLLAQRLGLLIAFAFLGNISTQAQDVPHWKIDNSHASVNFSVNHFFSAVTGKFKEFSGDFNFDPDNAAASSFNFTIQVASVDTDDEERDDHLQSGDFFDAKEYPTMSFTSTAVKKKKKDEYLIEGFLTIRGTKKKVTLPLKITGMMDNPWVDGKVILGIAIETVIDRTEYGVGTGSWAATAIVGDEVTINIAMELDGMAKSN